MSPGCDWVTWHEVLGADRLTEPWWQLGWCCCWLNRGCCSDVSCNTANTDSDCSSSTPRTPVKVLVRWIHQQVNSKTTFRFMTTCENCFTLAGLTCWLKKRKWLVTHLLGGVKWGWTGDAMGALKNTWWNSTTWEKIQGWKNCYGSEPVGGFIRLHRKLSAVKFDSFRWWQARAWAGGIYDWRCRWEGLQPLYNQDKSVSLSRFLHSPNLLTVHINEEENDSKSTLWCFCMRINSLMSLIY